MHHELKTINPFFQATWDRLKMFEVRLNDRDFKVNDTVLLKEYVEQTKSFTGRTILVKIIYILNDIRYCIEHYVIFGIELIIKTE